MPVEKDVTDTMYAALLGMKMGMKSFLLLGCLHGPRYDHTIANFNVMLHIVQSGGTAVMADENSKAFLLGECRLRLTMQKNAVVSVFPFGTFSCNVSYKGLRYPLSHQDLTMGDTLMGVSNQIVDNYAEIVVHAGYALAIIYNH
ncbi:MAG: thiamine diphosphokinase [Oscillospiraceae bacterium]